MSQMIAAAATQPQWPLPLIAVLGVFFTAVFVVALLVIGSLGKGDRGRELDRQIGHYGPRHAPATAPCRCSSPAAPCVSRSCPRARIPTAWCAREGPGP